MSKTIYKVPALTKLLAGWTIVRALPCTRAESIFSLEVTREGITKTINLFATDMGWWAEPDSTDHTWMHLNFKDLGGGKSSMCEHCYIPGDHARVAEPCKGTMQDWDAPEGQEATP